MFANQEVPAAHESRPVKRTRIATGAHEPDRFDFVSQPSYAPNGSLESPIEPGARKTHGKKQPLSCAECRRLKLKVSVNCKDSRDGKTPINIFFAVRP